MTQEEYWRNMNKKLYDSISYYMDLYSRRKKLNEVSEYVCENSELSEAHLYVTKAIYILTKKLHGLRVDISNMIKDMSSDEQKRFFGFTVPRDAVEKMCCSDNLPCVDGFPLDNVIAFTDTLRRYSM